MNIVVFGLSVSSSWGNGHATLWRGLCAALARMGHRVTFFERDLPYYAAHRDLDELPGGRLVLYPDWREVRGAARDALAGADVAIVTSYCPDAVAATQMVAESGRALRVFYDLDTPVTLGRLEAGEEVSYIGPLQLEPFDLVLSFTGGRALDLLRERLGARRTVPLYGWVDPDIHHAAEIRPHYRSDLSYLGTYSEDRQHTLQELFIAPAARRPQGRFVIGGAQYPPHFPWSANIHFVRHLPSGEHPSFFSSSRLTLNVTRSMMARLGWCPSGRLFEAAACGTPIVTDGWEGLDAFFAPGEEIVVARHADDVLAVMARDDGALGALARRARERTLDEHSAARRAAELVSHVEAARDRQPDLAEAES